MRKSSALLIVCLGLVFAPTAVAQVNDAELNGDYAFSFNGFTLVPGGSSAFAAVGRFTADGAGNIRNGELDTNGVGTIQTAQTFTATYTIGADKRGVMTLNATGGTSKFAFAMMANGNAQFVRFDAAGGTGTVGSGTIERVDTTAFNTARITADYAFGLAGFDTSSNRYAFVGRLTADGAGHFTNGAGDINAHGAVGSATFTTSSYAVSDTPNGRGTMTLAFSFGGVSYTLHFVFYIVNSGKLFAMETDALASGFPLLNGAVLQQQTPPGGFSSASLNGGMVISLTGFGPNSSGASPVSKAVVGLLTADGIGIFNLSFDENWGGRISSTTGLAGPYTVASNGRASIVVGTNIEIAYLVNPKQVFFMTSDTSVLFGPGDAQAAGAFTNSSVIGNYAGQATTPATSAVTIFSGEFSADGASSTGNLAGTTDIGNASGPVSGLAFSATYSISSSPTNGRGTVAFTSGPGGNGLVYVISSSKFVMISLSDQNPSVWLFEQGAPSPPPSNASLSSLTLNPTSVLGGVQSSTGTVTLSGPAPSGGVQVTLSSSNTAVARVPPSVTVQAGATSGTFTVTPSIVILSTNVAISASYNGTSQQANLTVGLIPLQPPLLR
jgi:hypothetical protein